MNTRNLLAYAHATKNERGLEEVAFTPRPTLWQSLRGGAPVEQKYERRTFGLWYEKNTLRLAGDEAAMICEEVRYLATNN